MIERARNVLQHISFFMDGQNPVVARCAIAWIRLAARMRDIYHLIDSFNAVRDIDDTRHTPSDFISGVGNARMYKVRLEIQMPGVATNALLAHLRAPPAAPS